VTALKSRIGLESALHAVTARDPHQRAHVRAAQGCVPHARGRYVVVKGKNGTSRCVRGARIPTRSVLPNLWTRGTLQRRARKVPARRLGRAIAVVGRDAEVNPPTKSLCNLLETVRVSPPILPPTGTASGVTLEVARPEAPERSFRTCFRAGCRPAEAPWVRRRGRRRSPPGQSGRGGNIGVRAAAKRAKSFVDSRVDYRGPAASTGRHRRAGCASAREDVRH